MMFIIANVDPDEAAIYLREHTSKVFRFKQLIELAQLVCSAGFSDIYKTVARGKVIQEWIKKNRYFTYRYMKRLWYIALSETNIKPETSLKLYKIMNALFDSASADNAFDLNIKTGIFRYKKGYESEFPSNTELPIRTCVNEYRKYITTFKFPREVEA